MAGIHFQRTYQNDPLAFVHDIVEFREDESVYDYQDEILGELPHQKKICVRGPHGPGKTALASWLVLWFALTRDGDDWKIPTTASSWRQLTRFLWPEVHKWSKRIIWGKTGRSQFTNDELLTQGIKLETGQAFAMASDEPDKIEGAHANRMLFLFDEAKAIVNGTWDSAEGAFMGKQQEVFAFAISTPGAAVGRFYDIHRKRSGLEDWWTKHITAEDCLKSGTITEEEIEKKRRLWGVNSPLFQSKILGEFPEQSEDALFSLSTIEAARERELEPKGRPLASLDVARFGDDDSCFGVRIGPVVIDIKILHGRRETELAGMVKSESKRIEKEFGFPTPCLVDNTGGYGSGVCDILHEDGFEHTPIGFGDAAFESEDFLNCRTEMYWNLSKVFERGEIDLTRIDPDVYDRLCGELTAIKYDSPNSKGQMRLLEKKQIKKETGQSPDVADMLAMLFSGRQFNTAPYDDEELEEEPYAEFA